MFPLFWKEIRENIRWLPIGLALNGLIVWVSLPDSLTVYAPVDATLVSLLLPIGTTFAFILGLLQSIGDLRPGSYAYLTHRAVGRSAIYWAKFLAGFTLHTLALSVPLMIGAIWLGAREIQAYPVRAAQVLPALTLGILSFVAHPCATITVARSASWWGTRLLPVAILVAAPTFTYVAYAWSPYGAVSLPLIGLLLVWVACAAERAWSYLACDPERFTHIRVGWALGSLLVVASLIATAAAVCAVGSVVTYLRMQPLLYPYTDYRLEVSTGDPWLVELDRYYVPESPLPESARGGRIVPDMPVDPTQPLERTMKMRSLRLMASASPIPRISYFAPTYGGYHSSAVSVVAVFDARGYLLTYRPGTRHFESPELTSIIAADKVYPPHSLQGHPFSKSINPHQFASQIFGNWFYGQAPTSSVFTQLLADREGIYQLDDQLQQIHQVLAIDLQQACAVPVDPGHAPHLLVVSADKLHEYQLVDENGSDTWIKSATVETGDAAPSAVKLSAKLVRSVALPFDIQSYASISVGISDQGYTFIAYPKYPEVAGSSCVIKLSHSGAFQQYTFKPSSLIDPPLVFGTFPPVLYLTVMAFERIFLIGSWNIWTTIGGTTLIAMMLVVYLGRNREMGAMPLAIWVGGTLFLGLAAPLAMMALVSPARREPCPRCHRPRRIDHTLCAHCSAKWEPPAEGIELFDKERMVKMERALF